MADKKISQLTALSAANLAPSTDVLAIVDTSATETKKILAQDLINGVLNVASAVGIGTASPAHKLQVVGTQRIEKSGAGYEASMLSFSTLTETSAIYRLGMATGGNFTIGRSDTSTTNLTLDSSGNLGIGTSSPGYRLDVVDTGGNALRLGNGTAQIGAYFSGGIPHFGAVTNHAMVFVTNSVDRGRFDTSGNFGVGTTGTITNKVEIACASGADRNIFLAGVAGASNGFYVQWNHATTKTHVRIADIPTSSAGLPAGTLWNDSGTLKIT